jgi:hypothetical protein
MAGTPEPLGPEAFVDYLLAEMDRLREEGGFVAIVLHLHLIREWLTEERLRFLLDRVSAARTAGDLWVTPMREVANHVLASPEPFRNATALDTTTWS